MRVAGGREDFNRPAARRPWAARAQGRRGVESASKQSSSLNPSLRRHLDPFFSTVSLLVSRLRLCVSRPAPSAPSRSTPVGGPCLSATTRKCGPRSGRCSSLLARGLLTLRSTACSSPSSSAHQSEWICAGLSLRRTTANGDTSSYTTDATRTSSALPLGALALSCLLLTGHSRLPFLSPQDEA